MLNTDTACTAEGCTERVRITQTDDWLTNATVIRLQHGSFACSNALANCVLEDEVIADQAKAHVVNDLVRMLMAEVHPEPKPVVKPKVRMPGLGAWKVSTVVPEPATVSYFALYDADGREIASSGMTPRMVGAGDTVAVSGEWTLS